MATPRMPGLPGAEHPPGAPGSVHALDLIGAINDFVAKLQATKQAGRTVLCVAHIGAFTRSFGDIPWPDMLASDSANMWRQKCNWLESDEGKDALAAVMQKKLEKQRKKGEDPVRYLDTYTQQMVQRYEAHQQQRTAEREQHRKRASSQPGIAPRCPSGQHGIGEGPCGYNDNKKWGE